MKLGEALVLRGLATPAQVEAALQRQKQAGGRLGAHLVAMGVLTAAELLQLLTEQHDTRMALDFCARTAARWEAEFGADAPSTARVRCNLAKVLLADGRAAEALAIARSALEVHLLMLGKNHSWTEESAGLVEEAERAVHRPGAAALASLRSHTEPAA